MQGIKISKGLSPLLLKIDALKAEFDKKCPLLIGEDFVLVGFKEKEWSEKL